MDSAFYELRHDNVADYFTLERNQNLTFPLHMHRCFEIILMLEGSAEMCIEKKKYTLQSGDMVLIKPNLIHDFCTLGESRHVLCVFAPELIAAISEHLVKYRLSNTVIKGVPTVYREMIEAMSINTHIGRIKGFLYTLCSLFYDQLDFSQVDGSLFGKNLLRDIFRYVEAHIANTCSIVELGDALDYSSSYLSRFFYTNVGMSYSDYVQNVKISQACYLLRSTQERIIDISLKCGYSSISSFNRNFKKLIGYSPTKYRDEKHLYI